MKEWPPRFNQAPTQDAPVVVAAPGGRRMGLMRWGLVPSWADDPSIGNRLINARAETAATKPAFRSAYRRRRCLIPADGFYEWEKPASGKGPKTPFYVHAAAGGPLGLAGLWERWRSGEGAEPLVTYAILTVDAPAWMRPLHGRMPAVLPRERWGDWLDPDASADALEGAIHAAQGEGLEAYEVTPLVNRPANDREECREPVQGGRVYPQGSTGSADP